VILHYPSVTGTNRLEKVTNNKLPKSSNLSSQFKVFGEGLEIVQNQVSEVNQKVDGLIEEMDMVKPSLVKTNNPSDYIIVCIC